MKVNKGNVLKLKGSHKLQELDVSDNILLTRQAATLAKEIIKEGSQLERLNLSRTRIEGPGAVALALALIIRPNVTVVEGGQDKIIKSVLEEAPKWQHNFRESFKILQNHTEEDADTRKKIAKHLKAADKKVASLITKIAELPPQEGFQSYYVPRQGQGPSQANNNFSLVETASRKREFMVSCQTYEIACKAFLLIANIHVSAGEKFSDIQAIKDMMNSSWRERMREEKKDNDKGKERE